ncbi:hypothetical protein SUGI_0951080 [Cryptomeria japonica]|nr:hypothetical protein SUGI_0951080 [Cryptomeria japonica]
MAIEGKILFPVADKEAQQVKRQRKGRGKKRKWQLNEGEKHFQDVASKLMSFSQQGPRAVCILSANGAISNVTLRQPATSGGTLTYYAINLYFFILSVHYNQEENIRSKTYLSVKISPLDNFVRILRFISAVH